MTGNRSIAQRFSRPTPREVIQFITHLVCILILFLLPEVIASFANHAHDMPIKQWFYLKPIVWIAVFYASYYFTTDPTSHRPKATISFILQILLILLLAMSAFYIIHRFEIAHLRDGVHHQPSFGPTDNMGRQHLPPLHHRPLRPAGFFSTPSLRDLLVTVLTIALGQTIKFIYKIQQIEQQKRELLAQIRDTELRELRAQLKPHFLFNTLNSIYALVDIEPRKAQTAIHHLSKLLRYMLYENKSHLTLGEETQFIQHYLDLVKLRLPSSVELDVTIDLTDCASLPIAPFLFINIVENAYKYGSRASTPGPILISITARDGIVSCVTSNNFDPIPDDSPHSGIGLSNLSRRLELQYPGRHSFLTEATDRFITRLSIDISTPPDMSPIISSSSNNSI